MTLAGEDAALTTGSSAPGAADPDVRVLERALGAQVRRLRREQELSAAQLAAASGLSPGMISKIESGAISPSLATLQALAAALATPLSALFASTEAARDCSFVPAGRGVAIERRGTKRGHVYELLGRVLGGELEVEPYLIRLTHDAQTYTGFHHAGTEFIYMLEGAVDYRHGDRVYPLRPGDSLLFDAAAPHGPGRLTELPATYLSIITYPKPPR